MVAVRNFGSFEGKRIDNFTLTSGNGVTVDIINWGVAVRDWQVPVKGGMRGVVLGFDSFEPYPTHSPHFGSLAGRVANRIAGSRFELDGETYNLVPNEGPNSLHGGPQGIGRLAWDAEVDDAANAVIFTLVSPHGAMGYPGTLNLKAMYQLTGNTLRLDLSATTDRPTPVSLVQHQYFNLGTGADILDHRYQLMASAYTEVGPDLIPTGNIIRVKTGDARDLRSAPRNLRDASGKPIDYDGNYVLDDGRNTAGPIATVTSPNGDMGLKLWSDRRGLQFYNGVMTDVKAPGLGGKNYGRYSGFCLEDQSFPDAVHNPHFPNVIITPDRPYSHWCAFEIAAR